MVVMPLWGLQERAAATGLISENKIIAERKVVQKATRKSDEHREKWTMKKTPWLGMLLRWVVSGVYCTGDKWLVQYNNNSS